MLFLLELLQVVFFLSFHFTEFHFFTLTNLSVSCKLKRFQLAVFCLYSLLYFNLFCFALTNVWSVCMCKYLDVQSLFSL